MKACLVFIVFVTSGIQLGSLADAPSGSNENDKVCDVCCSEPKIDCSACSACSNECYKENGRCVKTTCNMTTSSRVNCSVQDSLEPCKNNSCLNSGRCLVNSSTGRQFCVCLKNYYGPKCEFEICNTSICNNVGQCVVNSSSNQCLCPPGYYGKQCEIKICNTSACKNVGKCFVNSSSDYQCLCQPGYYGKHCEMKMCITPLCENGGLCIVNTSKDNQCLCRPGFYGDHCEMKMCDTDCNNGGLCIRNSFNDSRCFCRPGFYGDQCEMEKCNTECNNGGLCIRNSSNDNQCLCRPGFYGVYCDMNYKNDSTEVKHNCSDNPNADTVVSRKVDSEKQFTLTHVAIAVITAFLLGILLVLAVLGICRLRSHERLCFRAEPQRYEGKWEGASNTVTTKVIEKHSLKRVYENKTYESNADGDKDKVLVPNLTKDTYDTLSAVESNKPEHVYTGFERGASNASDNKVIASSNPSTVMSDSGQVYTDLEKRSSHIYETTRDSTVSEHAYFSLSNENFRTSNKNLDQGQASGTNLPTSKNENANRKDSVDDAEAYFVLETKDKTTINGGKRETENQEIHESTQGEENDNAYFVLQNKGENISQEGDVICNPYFTLEKE